MTNEKERERDRDRETQTDRTESSSFVVCHSGCEDKIDHTTILHSSWFDDNRVAHGRWLIVESTLRWKSAPEVDRAFFRPLKSAHDKWKWAAAHQGSPSTQFTLQQASRPRPYRLFLRDLAPQNWLIIGPNVVTVLTYLVQPRAMPYAAGVWQGLEQSSRKYLLSLVWPTGHKQTKNKLKINNK